ncbi:MAG TPA: AAA family ATPase, partial [Firmicutes bacterium]|nr:AAA family ATPase [Bacillota bacterium]
MELKRLKSLLKQKESVTLEFKEAKGGVPASFYESVCSFLNREGGDIFLGVNDKGRVTGVVPENADKMAADIASSLNNPVKLDPPFLLVPRKFELNRKILLHLGVPCSSRVHKAAGKVYDRSADGDFEVKDTAAITAMTNRKAAYYSETRTYPAVDFKLLDKNTIKKARRYIELHSEDYPWLSLKDDEMLKAAGLMQKDAKTGKDSITLAAILLFGKELTIQSVLPQYKTDVLLKIKQIDRYDDRMDLRVNLIESFMLLMSFAARHLPDPFYMEGKTRVSLRDKIFREIAANMIVHREYTSGYAGRFIIYKDRVEATNPCVPHYKGRLQAGRFFAFSEKPA